MSAIQAAAPVDAAVPIPRPARHRFWFPLGVLVILAGFLAAPYALDALDQLPGQVAHIAMIAEMNGIPGAALLIVLWWLFLSGFRWSTRLGVVLLVAGAVTGFIYSVRKWEMVKIGAYYVLPKVELKGQKTAEEQRAEQRAAQAKLDLPPIDLTIQPSDYARYRGAAGDGTTHGAALALDWSAAKPRLAYKERCGGGYAGFAVAGNVAITLEQRDDKGFVVCYDRPTGRERWTYDRLGALKDMMGDGPRSTPTIDEKGNVFALGATGVLVCLDGTSGKEQWKLNILEDAESKKVEWGLSSSPLLVDDMVVVNPGIDPAKPAGRAVCAYDRKTGKRIWAVGDHRAGYSSPRLATLAGVRQILLFDGEGLTGIDPANGKEHWRYPWATFSDMNNIQPLVYGDDRVFISSEPDNGCAMIRVSKGADGTWSAEQAWKSKRFAAKFSNPVLVGVAIYGLSSGDLFSIDAETGTVFWKERSRGRFGWGQLLAAGDKLIVTSDEGNVFLVAAETTAYKELGEFRVFERGVLEAKPKTWNTPALAGNQLFLRDNDREMSCVELPGMDSHR